MPCNNVHRKKSRTYKCFGPHPGTTCNAEFEQLRCDPDDEWYPEIGGCHAHSYEGCLEGNQPLKPQKIGDWLFCLNDYPATNRYTECQNYPYGAQTLALQDGGGCVNTSLGAPLADSVIAIPSSCTPADRSTCANPALTSENQYDGYFKTVVSTPFEPYQSDCSTQVFLSPFLLIDFDDWWNF